MKRFSGEVRRTAPAVLVAVLAVIGCRGMAHDKPPIHPNPNMDNQPKYSAQAESDFFADGATMRPTVAGTVARGELDEDVTWATGRSDDGSFVTAWPVAVGALERGAERYGIYCGPCHGDNGNGRGMLFQRSQVESADLNDPRIVALPDGQLFDVITNGLGLMPGYGYMVPVDDRWAIVAHMRTLQAGATDGVAPDGGDVAEEAAP